MSTTANLSSRRAYAAMVHMWMWWSVYTLARQLGHMDITKAHRTAQSACRGLYT